ncbi:MAG: glycosyltransferase [Hyphomicrobium sp.]
MSAPSPLVRGDEVPLAELARKARLTGNPVRTAVIEAARRPYWRPQPTGRLELLVFGGSQGARFFSEAVPPALARLPMQLRHRLEVVQQARAEDAEAVSAAYRAHGINADVAPFFTDLPERMARSHLVIARSGASTVAELTVMGRPSILVPLPHAIDNDPAPERRQACRIGCGLVYRTEGFIGRAACERYRNPVG